MSRLEFSWLGLVLVVPLFFDVYGLAPFEAAKAQVAILGAAVLLLVWAVEAMRRRRGGVRGTPAQGPRLPASFLVPAIFLMLAVALATLTSVAPVRSVIGAPFRQQGALFLLLCGVVGLVVAARVDSQEKAERLIWALIVPSVPVVAYALLQSRGWDFYAWQLEAGAASYRVFGTLGHPSFLAAYLVMVVPLTIVEAWRLLPSGGPHRMSPANLAANLRLVLLLLLATAQVTVLLWAERRAAFLGLLAAAFALVLLAYRLRLVRKSLAASFVMALLLVLVLVTGLLRPLAGRLAYLPQDDAYRTGHQRLLLWEATGQLLRAHPHRLFDGFGPATLDLVLPPYRPPALDGLVGNAPFDHAHNAAWEVLASTGVLGLFAYLALLLGIFAHGLAALGLWPAGRVPARLIVTVAGGALAGALGAALVLGTWGVALPAGLLGGVAGLFGGAMLRPPEPGRPSPQGRVPLRIAGLLSSLVGYVVVSQFNVPDVTTTLYFWVYAALLVAFAGGLPRAAWGQAELVRGRATVALAMLVAATLLFDLSGWAGTLWMGWPALALLIAAGAAVCFWGAWVGRGKFLLPSSGGF